MASWNIVNLSFVNSKDRIDADFYKKEYVELDKYIDNGLRIDQISNTVDLQSNGAFKVIFNILNDGKPKIVPYIRSGNVGGYFINKDDLHFISQEAHNKLTKTITQYDDILIARKGKIGGATIVLDDDINLNSNDNVVNIRLKDIRFNSKYFVAFWNSKYGLKQIERFATGNVQPWLSMKQVRLLKTVLLNEIDQLEVAKIVEKAYKLQKHSKNSYQQATELLDKEFGLDTIEFEKPRSYTASFSEVISSNRADSEYYQVHFRQIEEHLKSLMTLSLGTICSFIKGYEVGSSLYTESGPTFIRVSNFTKNGFSFGDSDKHISNDTYNLFKGYKPNIGDILLTKDGTVGMCYVVDEEIEGIISSGIVNLTLLDETIPKEYLALVINSKICQMQANRDCSGALISHWKPQDIRKMKIPLLEVDTMQQLNDLVVESKSALKRSKQLLEQAKQRVEELIENAAGVKDE